MIALAVGCGDDTSPRGESTAGTRVIFDLEADLASAASFYDLPFPLDLRLDAAGRPDLGGFPRPERNPLLAPLAAIAGDRSRFPVTPTGYFRFSARPASHAPDERIPAVPSAPILLVDVDSRSPERGRLFATFVTALEPDAYAPPFLLAVRAAPGIVLHPGRTYAFVVKREWGDQAGVPLAVSKSFAELGAGHTPGGARGAAARELYRPLWETLDALGVARGDVAAASVFSTGDVVAELAELSAELLGRYRVTIDDLHLDSDDGAAHERFCELVGTATVPQFQTGTPPFATGGLFELGADGLPREQRRETVPVVVTIPRQPMPPEGYPLLLYFHGSGGLASQVVDRGPITEPGGEPRPGEGPAHVLAAHGIATLASALPLNPERLPGAAPRAYLNPINLAAYRDTFRQGTIEQRLLIDAAHHLAIDPAMLASCSGPRLPAGAAAFRLQTEPMSVLGQSMGAQYGNFVSATDARVGAVALTGSGGLWSSLVLALDLIPGIETAQLLAPLLGAGQPITTLHPSMALLDLAWEAAAPEVYAPRLARQPLAGFGPRAVYQPIGQHDSNFPEPIFDAMALAHGNQQAGEILWPGTQQALSLDGLDGIAPYPVRSNRVSASGEPVTGVVVQYAGDGLDDPHHIYVQLDAVKHQYGCFFETFFASGVAVVPAPAELGVPCAGTGMSVPRAR